MVKSKLQETRAKLCCGNIIYYCTYRYKPDREESDCGNTCIPRAKYRYIFVVSAIEYNNNIA